MQLRSKQPQRRLRARAVERKFPIRDGPVNQETKERRGRQQNEDDHPGAKTRSPESIAYLEHAHRAA
jgi:hypothetical protein